MPRCDYNEIKEKFACFVRSFQTKDTADFSSYICKDVEGKISVSKNQDNDESGIENIKAFIENYPKTDETRIAIYNYTCRLRNDEAQQVGYAIIVSADYVEGQEEMKAFYYAITCADHWIRTEDGWKMNEIHMDVYPFLDNGLKDYFGQTWVFSDPLAQEGEDLKLPAICGEYDSPWLRIPDAEDVLSDEEKVIDCYNKCFFGADYVVFQHRVDSISRHSGVNSFRFGIDEARRAFQMLRYKRQKDRYWVHPFRHQSITFNEDHTIADDVNYRVFGWKQRVREYQWTRDNIDIEHVCNDIIHTRFVWEDGEYRSASYYGGFAGTGLYEIGDYSKDLYGDEVLR